MKYGYIIIAFLIGIVLTIIGALFKVMHWPYADLLLNIGTAVEIISLVLLIIKLIRGMNNNKLLKK
jgi:uncharacterized membrane protein